MEGLIVVNKPKGLTSHEVVQYVRKVLGIKRVGHSGTLDPLATGVLLIMIGRTTKFFKKFLSFDKEYIATLKLGKFTDTGDIFGKVLREVTPSHIERDKIEIIFKEFTGKIEQIPPMFSALKYKGRRLYELARMGKEVPRKARQIFIKELKLIDFKDQEIKFYVRCSSGTYIRKLAMDIAEKLGCVGCISEITRLSIGPYKIQEAIQLDQINESCILPSPEFS
ncbi:MAG: tRNA pseudouridine(55) synthase TruB [Candidatus Omnitrophica bacterium]|nr:tRNA pseudouridine(55) synthase TruB [Candidatus Omnitrophota bacterium]